MPRFLPRFVAVAALLLTLPILTLAEEPDEPVIDKPADWLTINRPASVEAGSTFTVEIQLGDIDDGQKVQADLQWHKSDGSFGGFNAPGQEFDAKDGGTYTVRFRSKSKDDLGSYSIVVFLSPNGAWKDRTASALSKKFPAE